MMGGGSRVTQDGGLVALSLGSKKIRQTSAEVYPEVIEKETTLSSSSSAGTLQLSAIELLVHNTARDAVLELPGGVGVIVTVSLHAGVTWVRLKLISTWGLDTSMRRYNFVQFWH